MDSNTDNTIYSHAYLNGFIDNEGVPSYIIGDENKILRVNPFATGIEWTDETTQDGFKADLGTGTLNTSETFQGFVFNTNETTGLFNYGLSSDTLGLRMNGQPILELSALNIRPSQKILFNNDLLLSNPNLCFGGTDTIYITGRNSTYKEISINTDNQENIRFSNQSDSRIFLRNPLRIENQVYSSSQPHIFSKSGSSNICGFSFDPVYNKIQLHCGLIPSFNTEFGISLNTMNAPLYQKKVYAEDIQDVSGIIYNVPTTYSEGGIYHMKRSTTADTLIILPFKPDIPVKYRIITDNNNNSSTFLLKLNTTNTDLLYFDGAGTRTLYLANFSDITLGINRVFDVHYKVSDQRYILMRVA
jgi:hypothetical protein